MQIFYTPDIHGIEHVFSEDESKHAVRVLRLDVNDTINLIDGKGTMMEAVITDAHPKRCRVLVKNVITEFEKRPYQLHLAIAPLKNPDRFEWFLEKATEIGVDKITPLLCHHSEKKSVNMERCNRIIESAMKQSVKAYHPHMLPLTRFEEILKSGANAQKLIATCEGTRKRINECYKAGENALVLIGPEGDFSEEEVKLALNAGFTPVSLGSSRLRTETAGIVACQSINFVNQI